MNTPISVFHKMHNMVSKLITIAVEHLKLLFHPVIVNAFVFYDANRQVSPENWGVSIIFFVSTQIRAKKSYLYLCWQSTSNNYV